MNLSICYGSKKCRCLFPCVSCLQASKKWLSKLVHSQIYNFAASNGFLNPLQSGFRKSHSTITALTKVLCDVRKNMDKREMTALVLLDLTKAFDRVNHKLLLIKLSKLGFSKNVIMWLKNYLNGRYQRV